MIDAAVVMLASLIEAADCLARWYSMQHWRKAAFLVKVKTSYSEENVPDRHFNLTLRTAAGQLCSIIVAAASTHITSLLMLEKVLSRSRLLI